MSGIAGRAGARMALAAALLASAACEPEAGTGAGAIATRAVVHAVLDPTAPTQVILVERSLLEPREEPYPGAYHPDEMILAHGGHPIRDARVVLFDAAGDSAVAVEDAKRRPDGVGAGVYRVATRDVAGAAGAADGLASMAIVPGATYRLRVDTPLGVVRGQARVPDAPANGADTTTVSHDVTRFDTPVITLATANAPYQLVSVSSDAYRPIVVAGRLDLRLSLDRLYVLEEKRTFLFPVSTCDAPIVSVSAVDANYAAYALAGDRDNLHGDDLRSAGVTGGSGVFGAIAPHAIHRLAVYASGAGALHGRWRAYDTAAEDPLRDATLCLYMPPTFPEAIDGTWSLRPEGPTGFVFGGFAGAGDRVRLTLTSPVTRAPDITVEATIRGDTLDGRDLRSGRRVRFLRSP